MIFTYTIYAYGPDTSNLNDHDVVQVKFGMYHNDTYDTRQRYREHLRHCPNDIILLEIGSNSTDTEIINFVTSELNLERTSSTGRESVRLTVKDLNNILPKVKQRVENESYGATDVATFHLREEQIQAVNFSISRFDCGATSLLWNCKPRFGKTISAYMLASQYQDINTTLILTFKPTDTRKSWASAINHERFFVNKKNVFTFVDAKGCDRVVLPTEGKTIVYSSFQDFNDVSSLDKWSDVHSKIDLLIIDEAHFGADTQNAKEIISRFNPKYKLFLSGTPLKAIANEVFSPEDTYTFSYIDEQKARLKEIELSKEDLSLNKSASYFWQIPIKILSFNISDDVVNTIPERLFESGYSLTELFSTVNSNSTNKFKYKAAVDKFVDNLMSSNMPYSSFLDCDYTHKDNVDCFKHTIHILPQNVIACDNYCKVLQDRLKDFNGKPYLIVKAFADNGGAGMDTEHLIKSSIKSVDDKLYGNKYAGTITVSCGKATHGMSIPEWSAVFMLCDTESAEKYIQSMFRVQTANPLKKYEGYVIDFSRERLLKVLCHTARVDTRKDSSIEETLTEYSNFLPIIAMDGKLSSKISVDDILSVFHEKSIDNVIKPELYQLFYSLTDSDFEDIAADMEDIYADKISSVTFGKDLNVGDLKPIKGNSTSTTTPTNATDSQEKTNTVELTDEQKRLRIKEAISLIPSLLNQYCGNSIDPVEIIQSFKDKTVVNITGISKRSILAIAKKHPDTIKSMLDILKIFLRKAKEEHKRINNQLEENLNRLHT